MSELKIRTNNSPRDVLRWWQLTEAEQKEFDYLDTDNKQMEAEFGRYRGIVYDLHDMEGGFSHSKMPEQFKGWHNYQSNSYFSGILIRWSADGESVTFATYTC